MSENLWANQQTNRFAAASDPEEVASRFLGTYIIALRVLQEWKCVVTKSTWSFLCTSAWCPLVMGDDY